MAGFLCARSSKALIHLCGPNTALGLKQPVLRDANRAACARNANIPFGAEPWGAPSTQLGSFRERAL